MNIVLCAKNCKYQKDGYCNINLPSSIINSNKNECLYFKNKNYTESTHQSSLLDNIKKTT